ncbi:hypothetical protein LWI29_027286 [Acer saccharum]|uniref:Uncharacterized protein n=1 Tax=Acer saccharum TaxID=4024 RepID=A0AA39SV50_ACESA|nr:hypothetical protein LWI29_027286 [Acer saccharum]
MEVTPSSIEIENKQRSSASSPLSLFKETGWSMIYLLGLHEEVKNPSLPPSPPPASSPAAVEPSTITTHTINKTHIETIIFQHHSTNKPTSKPNPNIEDHRRPPPDEIEIDKDRERDRRWEELVWLGSISSTGEDWSIVGWWHRLIDFLTQKSTVWCGHLGHTVKDCLVAKTEEGLENYDQPYGPWLKAESPKKNSSFRQRREGYRHEVCSDMQGILGTPPTVISRPVSMQTGTGNKSGQVRRNLNDSLIVEDLITTKFDSLKCSQPLEILIEVVVEAGKSETGGLSGHVSGQVLEHLTAGVWVRPKWTTMQQVGQTWQLMT